VVIENLDIAFPDKTEKEKRKIARRFYRNFTDFIIESIKAFSMSAETFIKRYDIENFDEVLGYVMEHNQGAVLAATHSFSWEWMISAGHRLPVGVNAYIPYTPLSNKVLDKLIRTNRERFGLKLTRASKYGENLKNQPAEMLSLCGMVADQSPKKQYIFRDDFFGVNVPIFTGPERLAQEMDLSYWFMNIRRVKRSYYALNFEMVTNKPNDYEMGELSKIYIQKTEELIKRHPDNYLWTHRRWKHRER